MAVGKASFLMRPLAILALLLVLVAPSQAQGVCGDRAEIIKTIAAKYKEAPSAWGIAGQRIFIELYLSETGSFTILQTHATGLTCIMSTGTDWQKMPPTIAGKPT